MKIGILTRNFISNTNKKLNAIPFTYLNAFKFSITPTHYIIMAVFVLAVGGYFVYRFIKINNTYKQIVDEYNKTGTITF